LHPAAANVPRVRQLLIAAALLLVPAAAPNAPPRAHATATATTITVHWAARHKATRYEVRYRRTGARRWLLRRAGHRTRYTVSRLSPGTAYVLELRACGARRCGRWSRALRVATRSAAPTCSVFPPDNPWNRDISHDPVDPNSAAYIASIGATSHLHPDFGTNPGYGIPYTVVGAGQRRVPIHFTDYGDESDPGPYPIPPNAPVEGAGAPGDRHVIVVQTGTCRLFELFNATRNADESWNASSGAVFDLRSNRLRPDGWTSADAAGLPIFAGLVRYDEVAAGAIDHAIRFTVERTRRAYIHPATHCASSSTDPSLPPMGLRLRLKAGFDISGFPRDDRVILTAMKRYGLIVADNGSNWFFTGAPDPRWSDDDLDRLKAVPGSAFEAVRSGAPHSC
jgi:Fibronectin type III domain